LTESELQTIYRGFNESARNSYWGRKYHDLLTIDIPENPSLKNLANGEFEYLIMDTTQYSLVIFSASWCGWCHEQIPLLKEIYADLHKKGLEITYITVDKAPALEMWEKVINKYEVPWRSLWSENATDQIELKFNVNGYPHAILFHPDGTSEKIDVRKEPDKEKLYSLLNEANISKDK
jgi:thiol-disulfide isomerase/thioredoxin